MPFLVDLSASFLLSFIFKGDRASIASTTTSFRGSTFSLSADSLAASSIASPLKAGRSPTLSRKGSVSDKSRRSSVADKIFKDEFESNLKKRRKSSMKSMSSESLLESESIYLKSCKTVATKLLPVFFFSFFFFSGLC